MENHEGKGGSYIRNPDGTLSLVERTLTVEEAAAIKAAVGEPTTETGEPVADLQPDPPAPSGKKKS